MNKLKIMFSAVSVCTALTSPLTLQAAPLSQNCELGHTCPIPGNDGGQTHFIIRPGFGTNYICTVKSDKGSLRFYVTSNDEFSFTHGGGLYNANPETKVEIQGRFKNPNDATSKGEIRFSKIPLTADGMVTCFPKK